MNELIQVVTTFGDRHACQKVAGFLIDERLAACVQIGGPVESWYEWEGQTEQAEEWVLTIKTTEAVFPLLEKRIAELHPYDEPEIIAMPITQASRGYRQWVHKQVQLQSAIDERSQQKAHPDELDRNA